MNVCGGHERSITHAGLRGALPTWIELVPGPGCPVCVCPEEDVYQAIQLALQDKRDSGCLRRHAAGAGQREKGRGALAGRGAGGRCRRASDRLAHSTREKSRRTIPDRPVVFFAAGFETTTAPVAAMLAEGIPDNLSILLSGRLTWPAVAMLLDSGTPGFDALVAPGHVSTIMGPEEWTFVVDRHEIPAAVAGFGTESLLASFYSVLRQLKSGERFLDNCYREVAHPGGNPTGRRLLDETLAIVDANWRGIGIIPNSGYALKPAFAKHDARLLYSDHSDPERRRAGEMPPGCDCAQVVLGKIYPNQCRIYGKACTPSNPVGPCMVSDEGACRIWWAGGVRVAVDA
jgi:hydrogenase expression/formation protein HypD